jgi:hypothetical protein
MPWVKRCFCLFIFGFLLLLSLSKGSLVFFINRIIFNLKKVVAHVFPRGLRNARTSLSDDQTLVSMMMFSSTQRSLHSWATHVGKMSQPESQILN